MEKSPCYGTSSKVVLFLRKRNIWDKYVLFICLFIFLLFLPLYMCHASTMHALDTNTHRCKMQN